MRTREKGLNIDVTRGQYMMLYNMMCEHNQMVNPQANPEILPIYFLGPKSDKYELQNTPPNSNAILAITKSERARYTSSPESGK